MFYHYSQNNSGGAFDFDAEAGISHHVVVEADNAAEADERAQDIGLYFDGAGDCSCCGNRWYPMHDSWGDLSGDDAPSVYSEVVNPGDKMPWIEYGLNIKWMGNDPEGFIHYADGRVEPFWAEQEQPATV